jgi:hypothetical protein
MHLLYFNGNSQESSHNAFPFLEAFQSKLPVWEIFTFFSVDNLVETLKKPRISFENIMLLHIHNEKEIDKVLEQQSLFRDVDIIMILSNISKSYSRKCYRIYPRMIFWDEPDQTILISVLMKKAQHLLQRHLAVLRASSGHELDKRPIPWQAGVNMERNSKILLDNEKDVSRIETEIKTALRRTSYDRAD